MCLRTIKLVQHELRRTIESDFTRNSIFVAVKFIEEGEISGCMKGKEDSGSF